MRLDSQAPNVTSKIASNLLQLEGPTQLPVKWQEVPGIQRLAGLQAVLPGRLAEPFWVLQVKGLLSGLRPGRLRASFDQSSAAPSQVAPI